MCEALKKPIKCEVSNARVGENLWARLTKLFIPILKRNVCERYRIQH